ncbi:MAG: hypothetical protein J6Y03_05990 [Alphaproteobacteria bacterium]|nr:hypothetical protein [Alphaproteobacteria bacterium]
MKLFLISFVLVLATFNSFAQQAETPAPTNNAVKVLFSEDLNEKLLENMRYRYSKKSVQTLLFRKRELEKQLRSQKLSDQTRQRLNLEYSVIQEKLSEAGVL